MCFDDTTLGRVEKVLYVEGGAVNERGIFYSSAGRSEALTQLLA